jgi:hypothetical protein
MMLQSIQMVHLRSLLILETTEFGELHWQRVL